jgi:hypothetical protein
MESLIVHVAISLLVTVLTQPLIMPLFSQTSGSLELSHEGNFHLFSVRSQPQLTSGGLREVLIINGIVYVSPSRL